MDGGPSDPTIDDLCRRAGLVYGETYRLPDVGEYSFGQEETIALYWPGDPPAADGA